jgi:pantetheine-phosphate adenylyltransferase
MKPFFVYPGSFCPPTYGHVAIANKAAELFGEITVICSENPEKEKAWFSTQECKEMWLTYNLNPQVKVATFGNPPPKEKDRPVVMVRGIRDDRDLEYEKSVVLYNKEHFNIMNYAYILSDEAHKDISSSAARQAALNFDTAVLGRQVSPMVLARMLEKALNIKNLFMVVGKAGSGKSTFLKMMAQENPNNVFINTDECTHALRPMLVKAFGDIDLVDMALKHNEELKKLIGPAWLELVKKELRSVPARSNVFLEVPYGMQPDKLAFFVFGGKIVYVGCENNEQNKERIIGRGTPEIVKFIDKIPGKEETLTMAENYRLWVQCVDTSGTLDDLKKKVAEFSKKIN